MGENEQSKMIIFLHGNDFHKKQKKIVATILALQKKRPKTQFFLVNEESFNKRTLEDLIFGSGLFDEKHIVVLNNTFRNKEAEEYLMENLEELVNSSHVFLFSEDGVKKDILEKISAKAYLTEDISTHKINRTEFNLFSLTDAFGRRDKYLVWKLFNESLLSGKSPENIFNILFWSIKSMRSASISSSFKDAGMKPFPYNKSKKHSQNYKPDELEEISLRLLISLQKDRRGQKALRFSIENLILEKI